VPSSAPSSTGGILAYDGVSVNGLTVTVPTRGGVPVLVIPGTCRIIGRVRLPPLIAGHFVRRDNRFRVTVEIESEPVAAHLPNSGRLTELLIPRRACWLTEFDNPRRKTRFDLVLVGVAGALVSVDARLPNFLFAEALAEGRLEPFRGYAGFEREVRLGGSRLDFRLSGPAGVCWVEVKSVTLVEEGVARFPDAPTARGARHVEELTAAVRRGEEAAVCFVVQRADARCFVPHDRADAAFGVALREAADAGVGVYAWACEVNQQAVTIAGQVPVELA
jgi:sugar fermentation stimulation protein A